MTDSRPLTCAVSQFALACNLTSAFYLLTLHERSIGWFFPQSLLVYAPLIYLLNHLFLRRERTALSLSILNCLLGGLMLAGYLLLEQWQGFGQPAFSAMLLIWPTMRGLRFALEGPSLHGLV